MLEATAFYRVPPPAEPVVSEINKSRKRKLFIFACGLLLNEVNRTLCGADALVFCTENAGRYGARYAFD